MEPIQLYEVHRLVKLMTATKDPAAVKSVFDVVGSKGPHKLVDFVRSATSTKNPEAVQAVFKWYKGVLNAAAKVLPVASHAMLAPVVIPKEALDQLERIKIKKGSIKT